MSTPLTPTELVDRLLPLVRDKTGAEIARLLQVDNATISRWKKGARPDYMKAEHRERLRLLVESLQREAAAVPRSTLEVPATREKTNQRPAPTFVEHVLFTAGRIAELANQIAHAAEKQLSASEDLGRRSQAELGARAPTAHHPPAKTPGKNAKRTTPRDGA